MSSCTRAAILAILHEDAPLDHEPHVLLGVVVGDVAVVPRVEQGKIRLVAWLDPTEPCPFADGVRGAGGRGHPRLRGAGAPLRPPGRPWPPHGRRPGAFRI